jgi:hypothetical protein
MNRTVVFNKQWVRGIITVFRLYHDFFLCCYHGKVPESPTTLAHNTRRFRHTDGRIRLQIGEIMLQVICESESTFVHAQHCLSLWGVTRDGSTESNLYHSDRYKHDLLPSSVLCQAF